MKRLRNLVVGGLLLLFTCSQLSAQQSDVQVATAKDRSARTENLDRLAILDTIQLPFTLAEEKRLSKEDILSKKEGFFVTGLPRFEFDPIRGFGLGGNVFFYQNKTKEDPLFYYTPYRWSLNSEFFVFENGRVKAALNLDVPYIFNSKWRLRADAVLWEDPNAQYWGIGRESLNPLRFEDKATGQVRQFNRVNRYEENLRVAVPGEGGALFTDTHFNQFIQREALFNLLGERVEMGGKLRLMFGYEMLFTAFEDYTGRIAEEAFLPDGTEVEAIQRQTLVNRQIQDGTWDRFNLSGFSDSFMFTSMLAGAIIYDTRDLEPDPSKGVFLQYSHEYSAPWLGSDFNFNKFMVQGQYVRTLHRWKDGRNRITFAGLAAFGHIFGPNINFIEMWDLSSQAEAGGILVLGGARSLRGYREARFLAPTVGLVNLEMRTRLYDFNAFNQHFALGLTPFYDFGTVWDGIRDIQLNQMRGAPGIGGRIAWNQSTVLRLDFATSREGSQFFFGFGHIF
ncbi:MAG: Omp85 family outer membrane protein [Nitritalea sp.]